MRERLDAEVRVDGLLLGGLPLCRLLLAGLLRGWLLGAAAGVAAAVFPVAAGALNCLPHGHLTTLPAADSGMLKTLEQAGHLIFIGSRAIQFL